MNRRGFLQGLSTVAAWSASPSLLLAQRTDRRVAALLLPLTGDRAAIGLSMQRAAAMAQAIGGAKPELIAYDTRGTAEGASAAAALAVRRGAALLIGPLSAAEVRPAVAAAAGKVPVLTFSNDEALRDSGAFLLGVTAGQAVATILPYARRRGIRRVALLESATPWGLQARAAAERVAAEQGMALVPVASPRGIAADALLVADGGAAFADAAAALQGSGVQLLGTLQALDTNPDVAAGAWIAAPSPAAFAQFARDYETRNGQQPGAVAGVAYDAAMIVKTVRTAGRIDRAALLSPAGFQGVTGIVRFREDGSATRPLAVLAAGGGRWDQVEAPAGS